MTAVLSVVALVILFVAAPAAIVWGVVDVVRDPGRADQFTGEQR